MMMLFPINDFRCALIWSCYLWVSLLGSFAHAQDYDPLSADRKIETRETVQQTMSEAVYERLSTAQELMIADPQEALEELESLEKMRLNSYERALVKQTYGYVHVQHDDTAKAINYFEECLQLDALTDVAQQGMVYSMAVLYAGDDQWQKSLDTMMTWFRYQKEPGAEPYMLIAQAYMQLENPIAALPYVRRAIETAESPNEPWYLFELAILLGQDRYTDGAKSLRTIVSLWPDRARHWEMLSGIYMELKEDQQALATLMLAYRHGLITDERKLLTVARMNMYQEIPEAAGKILEKEISNGRIQATEKNLKLMLTAWTEANEFDNAIATIDRLALLSDSGRYYFDKALLLNAKGDWEGVASASGLAVEKGGLDRPGEAYILMGMAHFELQQFQSALQAFRQAKSVGTKNVRRNADIWIEFVENR